MPVRHDPILTEALAARIGARWGERGALGLVLDPERRRAALRFRDSPALVFLLHPEEVVKRTRLLEKVWDLQFDPMSNVVDVHVANLREKLREGDDHRALIHTIRGVGYMMSEKPPDNAAL